MARRRDPHRPLALSSSHWRADGLPKVRYAGRTDALRAAGERAAEFGADLGVYRCDFCAGWHMGRQGERERD